MRIALLGMSALSSYQRSGADAHELIEVLTSQDDFGSDAGALNATRVDHFTELARGNIEIGRPLQNRKIARRVDADGCGLFGRETILARRSFFCSCGIHSGIDRPRAAPFDPLFSPEHIPTMETGKNSFLKGVWLTEGENSLWL